MKVVTPNASDVVVWSADVDSPADIHTTVERVPKLKRIKIDRKFQEEHGRGIIDELNERGLEVFDDAKIIEIPTKVLAITEIHLRHRPWMLNLMAHACSSGLIEAPKPDEVDALKRFADACHAAGTRPCAVTVLTSKTDAMVEREFNGRTSIGQVLDYCGLLVECGFTDVVCSTIELPAIREEAAFNELDTNVPGIQMPGTEQTDQARVGTPRGAFLAGATREVIGRALTGEAAAENFDKIEANLRDE